MPLACLGPPASTGRAAPGAAADPPLLLGVPYDRPVVGYGGKTINTLRLWGAPSPDDFDFGEFSSGDFFGAVLRKVTAENLTRVLYPDDSTERRPGAALRAGVLPGRLLAGRHPRPLPPATATTGRRCPTRSPIQLNDTHPAMAVAELMRILLDDADLGWDEAWDLTVRTLAYTNHTLLPEALEKWPVRLFELLLPRQLGDHLRDQPPLPRRRAPRAIPAMPTACARMSLIEEGAARQVRMAHLAIVGTHSTNGVAAIHSELLRTRVVSDFAEIFPERFNNKTNGVTPRRWLLLANPDLAAADHRGDRRRLDHRPRPARGASCRSPTTPPSASASARPSATPRSRFADWLQRRDRPDGRSRRPIFDCQIKRIHEYKRQLLNVLHVVVLYNRLRADPDLDVPPRTFFFAGKAAPAVPSGQADHQARSTRRRRRSTPTRPCAAGSRCSSCPTTASRWPSG